MRLRFGKLAIALVLTTPATSAARASAGLPVKALKVTVLSANLAGNPDAGIGEWGFAALLEADGQRL